MFDDKIQFPSRGRHEERGRQTLNKEIYVVLLRVIYELTTIHTGSMTNLVLRHICGQHITSPCVAQAYVPGSDVSKIVLYSVERRQLDSSCAFLYVSFSHLSEGFKHQDRCCTAALVHSVGS